MKTTSLLAILAAAVFAAPLQAQIVYDATADFSITNGNPNGAWSYGWMATDLSAFNLYTTVTTNNLDNNSPGWGGSVTSVLKNLGNEAVPAGWLSFQSGSGWWSPELSVVRWTSPFPGIASIHGRFLAENGGTGGATQVAVRMGGQAVWQAADSGEFDLLRSVVAGDTVDFAVHDVSWGQATPLEAIIGLNPTPAILFRRTSLTVQETEHTLAVDVLRFGPERLDEELTVDYTTLAGTARAGEDYVAASGTLNFAAGEMNKQIAITILDDTLAEGEEQFRLVLSNPTGGVSLGNSNVVIRIVSNEPMTYYVNVNNLHPGLPFATWATAATNIQDAVDVSRAGDTVLVTNGVYSVGGRDGNRVSVANALRLVSVNGPLVTIVVGSSVVTNEFGEVVGWEGGRCVYLGSNAVLNGFTLTNGFVYVQGGGVFSEPSGVVTNCVLTDHHSFKIYVSPGGHGGGAYGGNLYNCTLTNNMSIINSFGLGGRARPTTKWLGR